MCEERDTYRRPRAGTDSRLLSRKPFLVDQQQGHIKVISVRVLGSSPRVVCTEVQDGTISAEKARETSTGHTFHVLMYAVVAAYK